MPELLKEEIQRLHELMGTESPLRVSINEIDYENTFSDVQHKCATPEEVLHFLNKQLDKKQSVAHEVPVIPQAFSKRMSKEGGGQIDIDAVIREITKPPKQIWSQNEKMQKSSDDKSVFFNMGLPAIRGIVYDIEKKQFNYVNTCTGAGECKIWCYALKNNYIMFEPAILSTTRILNYILNYPNLFAKRLEHETESMCAANKNKKIYLRWHDSGDFFSKTYMIIARDITDALISKGYQVTSFAYTKIAAALQFLQSDNFIISFSDDGSAEEKAKLGDYKGKRAITVPRKITDDLFVKSELTTKLGKVRTSTHAQKDEEGRAILIDPTGNAIKNRIAKVYGIDRKTLVMNTELKDTLPREGITLNAIVPPHENDISATRRDVNTSFLLFH